jgi:integrase
MHAKRVKQLTFWAQWKTHSKGGLQVGSPYFGALYSNLNGKGLHTMRGVYEKVKGSKDFYIRYTVDGQRHREHVGRESAAIEALVNRRREIREGRFIAPHSQSRITFEALAEKMLLDKEARASSKTLATNRSCLGRILRAKNSKGVELKIGPVQVHAISTAHLNDILRAVRVPEPRAGKKKEKACRTVTPGEISGPALNGYRWLLNSIFDYGIDNGFLQKNPVEGTRAFAKHPGIIRYLLADEERSLRSVMSEWNPEMEAEFDLTLHTGLRRGELFHLTWDLIDLERGILTVPHEGKTGRRFVPINSVARQAIETLYRRSAGSRYVAYRTQSDADNRNQRFQTIVKKAGVLKFRWHDIRHTFASRLVMAGVDLRTVQQFMGHKSIVTTMRYAHLSPEHGKAAIERLVPAAPAIATAPARRPLRKASRASAPSIAAKPAKIASVA